jgi:two-component system, NarL family, nitrate/nitrite response regulator NarL
MDMYERTAVLLDGHPLWLKAMAELLERVGVKLVGSTTEPSSALDLVEAHQPDVFVMTLEWRASEIDGYECLRRTKLLSPKTQTVVVSSDDDPRAVEAAFAEGATAFCTKSAEEDDLAVAIRQSFSRSIYLVSAASSGGAEARAQALRMSDDDPELTKREVEILQLVSEGHSNSQVARMLWVTEQTVKFHLSNIYRKLNVANRTEASRWAQLHGLLSHEPARPTSVTMA